MEMCKTFQIFSFRHGLHERPHNVAPLKGPCNPCLKYYHRAQLNMRNHPNGTDHFFNGTEK